MTLRAARPIGAVILDTNVFKFLASTGQLERLRRSLSVCDLEFWPSAYNVLECVATENPRVRNRLLATIAAVSRRNFLLPLIDDLLANVAASVVRDEPGFELRASELEWMVHEPERVTDEYAIEARGLLERLQGEWETAYRTGRRAIRQMLRRDGQRDPWGSAAAFLDQQWMAPDHVGSYVERMYGTMRLPGAAPVDALLASEAWRLYFKGLGVTVYERCVLDQSPRPAHVVDVMQLVYLAGSTRRIFVTDDSASARVASAVLVRRHAGARVMTPAELLDAASC